MSSRPTSSDISATLPFYSPDVRTALLRIIEANPNPSTGSASSSCNANSSGPAALGTVVRGKYRTCSESSEEETSRKESDDASSSSSSSELERVSEEEEGKSDARAEQHTKKLASTSKAPHRNPKKKSKSKRSKDEILSKLNAPSIALPLPPHQDDLQTESTLALHVPTILLPHNYLRDDPDWTARSAAERLLSTWDTLNGTSSTSPSSSDSNPTMLIVLIQSGRFASAVFSLAKPSPRHPTQTLSMLAHKTSTRYTVRKGQGGSQSSHDQSKSKAKSVGSQLRREGERQLRSDAVGTWKEWKRRGYVDRAVGVWVGVPKGMRREYLHGGGEDSGSGNGEDALVEKGDERLRSVPLDCGRPTLEAVQAVMECLLRCEKRETSEEERWRLFGSREEKENGDVMNGRDAVATGKEQQSHDDTISNSKEVEEVSVAPPYTPLHEAAIDGDLSRVMELLQLLEQSETQQAEEQSYDINTQGGAGYQTPLHLAASSTHDNAPDILNALLLHGHANPCAIDSRGRPPYFLASSDKLRETFRLARGLLGEEHCSWDDGAKVGPPLTAADIEAKKAKAAEKKKRQRARQKEKKAEEKAAEAEAAAKLEKEREEKKREEEAKRVRDGLKPKATSAANVCDFCQKLCKGKKRSQMFQRLEYAYCSTDCVRKHQRELAAAAAMTRMGG